jgi:uncharacterized protein YejL (UPF0352 family)
MKANFEILYEHIGYLFYALASEFHKLSSYEDSKLNELINEHWKILDSKEAPLQLLLNEHLHNGVHNAMSVSWNPDQAFRMFEDFYLVHRISFGDTLREKIQKCSDEIVHDYCRLHCDSKIITELKWLLTPHYNNGFSISA